MRFEQTIVALKELISRNNDEIIRLQNILGGGKLTYHVGKNYETAIKSLHETTKDHQDVVEYLEALTKSAAPTSNKED